MIMKEMIYVVTRSEEHCDYVEAAYHNREDAEKHCSRFNGKEDEYHRDITEVKLE